MEKAKKFFRDTFSLTSGSLPLPEIELEVKEGAAIKGANMCILICAIFIASIGLNMNSTAVIIGAMLISPLMGGIIAMGYGFASGSAQHTKNAFFKFALQIVISLLTSFVYFKLSPMTDASSEILARTTPTVWDVLIACFGGFAGVIGITRNSKTNVIPGVAIATALMPPLCTAGYGLARGSLAYFGGAMYLFTINTIFICLTAAVGFKLLKVPVKSYQNPKTQRRSRLILMLIMIVTVVPSIYFATQMVSDAVLQQDYKNYVAGAFDFPETQVVNSKLLPDQKLIEVALVGKMLSDSEIQTLATKMSDYNLNGITLRVNQTTQNIGITKEDVQNLLPQEAAGAASSATLQDQIKGYQQQLLEYQAKVLDVTGIQSELKALYPQVGSVAGAILEVPTDQNVISTDTVLLLLYAPTPLSDGEMEQIKSWIKVKTNKPHAYVLQISTPFAQTDAVVAQTPTATAGEAPEQRIVTEVTPDPAAAGAVAPSAVPAATQPAPDSVSSAAPQPDSRIVTEVTPQPQ